MRNPPSHLAPQSLKKPQNQNQSPQKSHPPANPLPHEPHTPASNPYPSNQNSAPPTFAALPSVNRRAFNRFPNLQISNRPHYHHSVQMVTLYQRYLGNRRCGLRS
ncbi:hypothetical protein EMPG_14128 [Blastomyces silverae]|uniref:Uncharacterized protein n=1 Tax=Blastomyces silverae TaxID=2060906 RepID=A0A0H1BMV4_9EURO|nr:hypothetical protein EMPG_14128 [Blastomyces silverae]